MTPSLQGLLAFRSPWSALSLSAMLVALSVRGYEYRFDRENLTPFYLFLAAVLAALLFAALAIVRLPTSSPSNKNLTTLPLPSRIVTFLLTAMTAHQLTGSSVYDTSAGTLAAGIALLFGVLCFVPVRPLLFAVIGVSASLLLLSVLILGVPFDKSGGDMLDLIDRGADRLISGTFPYEDLRIGSDEALSYSERPLTYPPLMWLPYVPFKMAGLDLRLLSLLSVAILGLSGLLLMILKPDRFCRETLAQFLVTLYLSPVFLLKVPEIQTPFFWLVVVFLLVLIWENAAPIAVGLVAAVVLCMRESAVILMPILGLYYWRQERWRGVVFVVGLGLTAVAVLSPFVILDAPAFVSSLAYNAIYEAQQARVLEHVGFGPWLGAKNLRKVAVSCQMLVCGLAYWYFWQKRVDGARLAVLLGVTYCGFMLFNSIAHEYYYIPGLILIGFGQSYVD